MKAEEFWSKVMQRGPHDCWNWTRGRTYNGFARLHADGKQRYARDMAWFFTHGRLPRGFIVHTCGNRMCCNPAHLYASEKDTRPWTRFRGGAHANAKLTDAQAAEIRSRWQRGGKQVHLAKEFGVSRTTIARVVNEEGYK
jgi:hypothetical protein